VRITPEMLSNVNWSPKEAINFGRLSLELLLKTYEFNQVQEARKLSHCPTQVGKELLAENHTCKITCKKPALAVLTCTGAVPDGL